MERLLKLSEVLALLGISRSAWYDGIAKGIYPKPVKLGCKISRWQSKDIKAIAENGTTA